MAASSESTKYTGKTRADRLIYFAAEMSWLTSGGRRLSPSELSGGISSLSGFSSVELHYGRVNALFQAEDTEGFKAALQDASREYSDDCVLKFAADSGILFDGDGNKIESSDLKDGASSLISFERVTIDDDGKTEFNIVNEKGASDFIKQLKAHLPSVEVIDLVDIAIDCGIVTEITEERPDFSSYKRGGNYYSALCNVNQPKERAEQNRIFKFRLEGQDASSSDFYVTFDARQNDIRSETEYASRASVFIDTLMKLVMAKYNVLIVHKAAMETDEQIPNPPYYDGYSLSAPENSKEEAPTESTQSQLKVLIRYKDTVKRTSFTANVIDDIFVTFDEDETGRLRPRWGFSNITPGQSEPTPEKIDFGSSPEEQARGAKEIENVLRVKELSEQKEVKYTIFEELRRNEKSNLHRLIKQREEIYRDSALSSKEIPKVEFSLTPLTIYSNHIVSRTLIYHISGKNPAICTDYGHKFDPLNPNASKHSVEVNGETHILTPADRLVILLKDGKYIPGCESVSVRLSSVNPEYYPEREYGDIFYLKNECVPASKTGYTGLPDGALFYKDDLQPSALSSYGVKYLRRKMTKMPVGARYFTDGVNPELCTVSAGEQKYAPEHCREHRCPICDTSYFAEDVAWTKISDKYRLATGGSCCPECAGRVFEKGGRRLGVYELKSGENTIYCVDDPEKPQHLCVCSQCRDEGKDGLVFADTYGDSLRCGICGEISCGNHSTVTDGKTVCKLCSAKGRTPFGRNGDPTADVIWSKIKINLPLSPRSKLDYSLHGRWLRVFNMKDGNVRKIYIFIANKNSGSLKDKKFVFVKAKSLKKQ